VLLAVFGYLYVDGTIEAFPSRVLLNDGETWFHDGTEALIGASVIASADFAAEDFDGDGDVDLVECAAEGRSRFWMQAP